MVLTIRHRAPVVFTTRRSRWSWSRKLTWLHCFGYLVLAVTLIKTISYFKAHPDLSLRTIHTAPTHRRAILRPGQYREVIDLRAAFEAGALAEDTNVSWTDDMGRVHDKRDIQFYLGGTLTLSSTHAPDSSHPLPLIYDPYPDYNSRVWRRQFHGRFQPCLGPRGRNLDRSSPEDMVQVYKGNQAAFPAPLFGSYEAMGLDGNVCTDRYSRLGAYGYGADSKEDVPGFQRPSPVTWDDVDWSKLQGLCFDRNVNRFKSSSAVDMSTQHPISMQSPLLAPRRTPRLDPPPPTKFKQYYPRSAVLIRTWHDMRWTASHREYLRALIMELALHSGAEYEVFLLVHVRDDALPIFSDMKTIEQLKKSIPAEFRNMAVFFNTKLLEAWYPKIPEHSPMLQHHQPVQIFSQLYPNFDYYWQLEMDSRLTGHSYHFLERAARFAEQQPRKYLWERNAYFYTPGAHGAWANFTQMVHDSLAPPSQSTTTIWGPVSGTGIRPLGPEPPSPHAENDSYTWGVGEEADLITFLPIFNPQNTTWTFPNHIWNFRHGPDTPRRAAVITMGRYSKRLLDLVHEAQATRGLGLASEMTGPSWALFHGLKAVHVPHPIYADGLWTPAELAAIYNRGPPDNINGAGDSIWNWDHRFDHIMYRLSYMFTTHTGEDLYRRWLGYRTADNEGGKMSSEIRYGRHCFPSMFLHPIKNTVQRPGPDKAVP